MNPRQVLNCPECGYEANAPNATHCAICDAPLDKEVGKVSFLEREKRDASPSRMAFVGKGALSSQSLRSSTAMDKSNQARTNAEPKKAKKKSPSPLRWLILAIPPLMIWAGYSIGRMPRLFASSDSQAQFSGVQLRDSMSEVQNVPSGIFNYGGALQFAALASNGMNKAINQAYPGFRLRYTEPLNEKPGSGTSIAMLFDGEVSFAQSGRPLEDDEYNRAQTRGFTIEQAPIAIDGVAIYTHPGINIPGISVEQLQSIYIGKVTNWKQLGGPDLPIKPISRDPKATTTLKMLLKGLKGAKLGKNVQIVRDYTTSVRTTASTPGGISYGSAPSIIGQKTIRPLALAKTGSKQYVPIYIKGREGNEVNKAAFLDGTYPLTRRLFVIIRHDGTLDEQAGTAYANLLLTNEGQKLIEKAGFVAIRQ
jgi:ABC-type phosphate transport system substrate-binding protein